jgi:hypothetical protein
VALLTAEAVLSAEWPSEIVSCPEWGGDVRVRAMSAADFSAFHLKFYDEDGKAKPEYQGKMIAAWVLACAVNEQNENLFTEEQLDRLSEAFQPPLYRCFLAARRVNGEGDDEPKKPD